MTALRPVLVLLASLISASAAAAPVLEIGTAAEGHPWTVRVSGLEPGDRIFPFVSAHGTGEGPCGDPGVCLDIVRPRLLPRGEAASDVATVVADVPARMPRSFWLQVAIRKAKGAKWSTLRPVEVDVHPHDDPDGDGLSDAEEALFGTDPRDPDADGDHLYDGAEIALGLDPFDPDFDGDGKPDGLDAFPDRYDPDPHVVVDVPAGDPTASIPDPEFDEVEGLVVWQTPRGSQVWLTALDPLTGDLVHPDGRGTLLARNVAPMSLGRNGPEFLQTADGPKPMWTGRTADGTPYMAYAERTASGAWRVREVPGSLGKVAAIGSLDVGDPDPRFIWYEFDKIGGVPSRTGWTTPVGGDFPRLTRPALYTRWVQGERALIFVSPVRAIEQVFRYDIDTGVTTQLTNTPFRKTSTFAWHAPELGGELVLFAVHADADGPKRIVAYRQKNGAWKPVLTIPSLPAYPYVISPEPFVHEGRSYVTFHASTKPRNFENGEAVVVVASFTGPLPLVRVVSDTTRRIRKDPETWTGGVRPWTYYTVLDPTHGQLLRRCELGL